MTQEGRRREIRSYVLRTGRMTEAQQRAFDTHWSRWGLTYDAQRITDTAAVFGRQAPLVLEIGYGMGSSLAEMAQASPQTNFIGIEVHTPGVGRLMHELAERELTNVRTFHHDAVEVVRDCLADDSLDTIQIFFPDPWHKKRHHKRRLIRTQFVELLLPKLKSGGRFHLATDWENYAEQMMSVLSASPSLYNTAGEGAFAPRPDSRPLTKFERRGERLGHGVWDLVFERVAPPGVATA